MSWLVVTPARNEAAHLPVLAASLAAQDAVDVVGLWVIVDDASTDGTAEAVDRAALPFPVLVIRREPGGQGLRRGGAFAAFFAGAEAGLRALPGAERVMKLDADMVLCQGYLRALAAVPLEVALAGGVLEGRGEREWRHHVRGSLKAYNRAAFELVRKIPAAAGHDVVDEVAIREAGGAVVTVPAAVASVQRRTGLSEGSLAGRLRNGEVSRLTGYHPVYFGLRLARYASRRPVGVGAIAMAIGWLRAGASPFDPALLRAHRRQQTARLRAAARHPRSFLREAL